MKMNKAEKLLKKINVLFDSIKGEEELSLLELDLLKEYVRKFYNKLDSGKIIQSEKRNSSTEVIEVEIKEVVRNAAKTSPPTVKKPRKIDKVINEPNAIENKPTTFPIVSPPVPEITKKPEVVEQAPPIVAQEKIEYIKEVPQTMIDEVIPSFELEIEDSPVSKVVSVVHEKSSLPPRLKPTPQSTITSTSPPLSKTKNPYSYDELFEIEESNSLSQKLSNSKIQDIRSSMGLNERVLTINDLFNGNALTFDKVLKKLNALSDFNQARVFLTDEVIPQFDWDSDKKLKKAKVFVKLIRRRY